MFVAGDEWTYRYNNRITQTQSQNRIAVKEVRGAQVIWEDGGEGDLVGNITRSKRAGVWHTFTPSSHMYVFPLHPGSSFTLKGVQAAEDKRTYDLDIAMAIGGEEEIQTPAGKFRAVKIDRTVKWVQREKPSNAGLNKWTYWYSAEAKRWIVAEQSNVTTTGKQLNLDRWELESYKVR